VRKCKIEEMCSRFEYSILN